MGQMKKLYELAWDGSTQAGIYFIERTARLTQACEDTLDLIRKAEFRLNDWLVCNTDKAFGEQRDIDAARNYLIEAIELLEGPPHERGYAQGASESQLGAHEDRDHLFASKGD